MNTPTALFIAIASFFIIIAFYCYQADKEFERWYQELLKQAPYHGFTEDDIEDFERGVFWRYYSDDMTIQEAMQNYLSEN